MVIIHLSGGFGNQLYSYAFGYSLAQKRQDTLVIDTAIQDADWFFRNPDILELNILYDKRISYKISRKFWDRLIFNRIRYKSAIGWSTKKITEGDSEEKYYLDGYYQLAKPYQNVYMKGNWGTRFYFRDYENEIRRMFTFQNPLSKEAQKVADEIRNTQNSVTLHWRRSDYVRLGSCLSKEYFEMAMEHINLHLNKPVFFVFSEDKEWVRQQFCGLPYHILYPEYKSEKPGIEDFRLLMTGENQIISNSSYSWWAAYLNPNPKKIVIAPEGRTWTEDFRMEEWVGIKANFEE